jgi:hypothetical protein
LGEEEENVAIEPGWNEPNPTEEPVTANVFCSEINKSTRASRDAVSWAIQDEQKETEAQSESMIRYK